MDILERYLGYEGWTLDHLVQRCAEVSRDDLHASFDVGPGSVHKTLVHVIRNLEVWTDLMRERPVRDLPPIADSVEAYRHRLDAAMADFADCARSLAAGDHLERTYIDTLDKPPTAKTFGGTILHVLTHTTVHRWELQHILQRLGVEDLIEGDALGWEWRLRHDDL